MKPSVPTDPLEARRRRGVRITVAAIVAVAVLIYIGVLTGVLSL